MPRAPKRAVRNNYIGCKMTGKGGYFGRLLGGAAHGAMGKIPYVGGFLKDNISKKRAQNFGDKAGDWIWDNLKKITGFGDYKFKRNSILSKKVDGQNVPVFSTKNREIRIRHREYVQDIISSPTAGVFNVQANLINPGNATMFPWLANLAVNFEEWKANGIVFEYKSTSVDSLNSTNTALGQVVMATNYNANAPNFLNKQAMDASEFSSSNKPSRSFLHGIECDPHQTYGSDLLYVTNSSTTAGIPAKEDVKSYFLGNLQVATGGMQATSVNIGELWVSYDITLLKPILQAGGAVSQDIQLAHYTITGTVSTSAYFGTGSKANQDNIGLVISGNTIKFPTADMQAGDVYMMLYIVNGTGASVTAQTYTLTNMTGQNILNTDSANTFSGGLNGTGVTVEVVCSYFTVTTSQLPTQIVISGGVIPTSPSDVEVFIIQMPNPLV